MLSIKDLHAEVDGNAILNGINLTINSGEVHAIMGLNGSGKSTLANVLAGHDSYNVTVGSITYKGQDLIEMAPEIRAREGVFLAFQYPTEIPGVANIYLLKAAINAVRAHRGLEELDAKGVLTLIKEKTKLVEMKQDFLYRAVNQGFSGGEKKRNEILQMTLMDPYLCVLDETDSGLDIDALKVVSNGVNSLRDTERSFIVVTHYQRLLDYIVPDFVHIMHKGKIVRSGDKTLALELEEKGYSWLENDVEASS